jgi:uroporphyrinogen decarboxylase
MTKEMSSRERIRRTLQRKPTDRTALDIGSTPNTGINLAAYAKLVEYFGLKEPVEELSAIWQLARPSESVLARLSIDTRGIFGKTPETCRNKHITPNRFADEWGIVYERPNGELYFDIAVHPLATAECEDLDRYPWPPPAHPERIVGLKQEAERLNEDNRFALMGMPAGGTSLFERCWYLRGFENFLSDLLLNKRFVHGLLEALLDLQLVKWKQFLDEIGTFLDVIVIGDDLAGQLGPLISPDLYREMIKPYQAKYFKYLKERTDAKLFYHSCGCISGILDDLIAIGIDIINPVQTSAKNMGPEFLKEEFGNRVIFWGAVDTHELLRRATPAQVIQSTRELIKILGRGGGYVVAANHNIQPDVPPQNVVALADSVASRSSQRSV